MEFQQAMCWERTSYEMLMNAGNYDHLGVTTPRSTILKPVGFVPTNDAYQIDDPVRVKPSAGNGLTYALAKACWVYAA